MCIGTSSAKAVCWLIASWAFCQCSAIELPKATAQENAAQENSTQENSSRDDAFDINPFIKEASDYHFRLKEAKQDIKDFELRGKPIMIWSNPAKFDQKGCVLAWMHDGRPQVIGTLYSSVHRDGTHRALELHSLSRQAIEGRFKETPFWAPTVGVQFESLEGTTPGPTVQRRMLQMRQMSREFSVELVDQGDKQTLRLLPTPVITYEPNSAECVDGAVFAFAATGTDPDSFLIIETVKQSERLSFQYAFARFHFRELTATRNEQVVWHVDGNEAMLNNFRGSPRYRNSSYNFFRLQ